MIGKSYYSEFYPVPTDEGVEGTTIPTPTPSLKVPLPITFVAGPDGVLTAGQLPKTVTAIRLSGTEDVSASTTWAVTPINCTATVDTAGNITITAVAQSGQITVSSTYKGVVLVASFLVNKSLTPTAPPGDPDAEVVYNYSFNPTDSNSYTSYSPVIITITAGSTGSIVCESDLSFHTSSSTVGTYTCSGKWQYREVGTTTWIDVDSEVSHSSPARVTNNEYLEAV